MIVMQRHVWSAAWDGPQQSPERAGTPAVSCCACCSATPSSTVGPLAAGSSAGAPVTDVHPQLPQLADRVFAPTDAARLAEADVVFLALPHGAVRRAGRRSCPPTSSSSTSAPTTGWPTPRTGSASTTRPTPGSWPYGLPELFRARAWSAPTRVAGPAATRPPWPWRSARCSPPGWSSRRRRGRGGQRHQRRRPGREGEPARQRGRWATCQRLQGRRATGTPPRCGRPWRGSAGATSRCRSRRCWRRCRAASSPPAPPAPRRPRPSCARRCRRQYADEPFVHVLPEGRWPHTAADRRQQRLPAAGDRRRRRRPRRRRQRDRQPRQGRGRAGAAVRQPRARPARDRRPERVGVAP